jgi:hypothetical protein
MPEHKDTLLMNNVMNEARSIILSTSAQDKISDVLAPAQEMKSQQKSDQRADQAHSHDFFSLRTHERLPCLQSRAKPSAA